MYDSFSNKKVGIVAHDAGGAEIVSSFVKRSKITPFFCIKGPAVKVFESKFGTFINNELDDVITKLDVIICGTGWETDYEWLAIKLAKMKGIPIAAFLDHWGNYLPRFIRAGQLLLPTEIWVGDIYAEKIASSIFHLTPIKLIENPYLLDIKERLLAPSTLNINSSALKILYLCEPIQDYEKFCYTESMAMNFFLETAHNHCKITAEILIRPHPSENEEKYFWMKYATRLDININKKEDLLIDISRADVVVGRSSMGLVVALAAGKPATTCIPPGGRPCTLPHEGINDFKLYLNSLSITS